MGWYLVEKKRGDKVNKNARVINIQVHREHIWKMYDIMICSHEVHQQTCRTNAMSLCKPVALPPAHRKHPESPCTVFKDWMIDPQKITMTLRGWWFRHSCKHHNKGRSWISNGLCWILWFIWGYVLTINLQVMLSSLTLSLATGSCLTIKSTDMNPWILGFFSEIKNRFNWLKIIQTPMSWQPWFSET